MGVFRKMGEGEGRGGGEVTLLFQSFRMLITPAKPNSARACARLLAMVLAGVQECAEDPLLGTGRNAGRQGGGSCV